MALLLATGSMTAQNKLIKHLDVGITAGSPGIGIDLATPIIEDKVQLRVGGAWMPHINLKAEYTVEVGELGGTKQEQEERFNRLADLLYNFTGQRVTNKVGMDRIPTLNNVKMLVDVFPFKNKKWHITGGFYWGGKQIGKAYNDTKAMTCLNAVMIYNSMYEKALAEQPLLTYNGISVSLPPQFNKIVKDFGDMAIRIGDFAHDVVATEDIYWEHDGPIDDVTLEPLYQKGDLRCAKGEVLYHEGDPYRMKPSDIDGMVRASARVNSFKPYLGFGYGGNLHKNERINLSFDCGCLFWGSDPAVKTHEGVNISHDLTNLHKSIRGNVELMKALKVYPVIDLRVSYRLY